MTEGHVPGLNDLGEIAYNVKTDFTPWQIWLYNDGNPCRLTSQEDVDNITLSPFEDELLRETIDNL